MMNILKTIAIALIMIGVNVLRVEAAAKSVKLISPDGKTEAVIEIGNQIHYYLIQDGEQVLAPSQISMSLTDGSVWGVAPRLKSVKNSSVDKIIETPNYRSTQIHDNYNQVALTFQGDWQLEFRAFNDAVAYRFISNRDGKYEVLNEQVDFNFLNDDVVTVAYVPTEGTLEEQLFQSFENTYSIEKFSELNKNRLMMLPLSVMTKSQKRVTITESDLRDYPGMYLKAEFGKNAMEGFFAPLRDEINPHTGHNNLQVTAKTRHNYIAKVNGPRSFPWRIAVITSNDVELANTEVVYKLASENVLGDVSWVKPGKVAWDWWNNWNLEGVDFKAGVNNETYKYFIDFASKNGIEYVILDEGWSVNKVYDLMQVVPEINLKELIDYASERGVGIILWAGYYAFDRDMEQICRYYSEMGVKGFKVDFMNGDDQELISFNERAAKTAAKYKLMIDLHGTSKPTGLERTYPNIVNYEGVHGLEQMKWADQSVDQVTYDVTMPYLRMVAGPVDYTQGAMTNAVRSYNALGDTIENQYYPSYTKPMSQGTRMRQLAQYVVFFSPLNMMSDTPTAYEKNPVSTAFIASVPTVWDESRVVEGVMGEYIITARRSGDRWFIGGINNWDVREVEIDVEKITGKKGKATLYKDGVNANNNGMDFAVEDITIDSTLDVEMAAGGGFVVVI